MFKQSIYTSFRDPLAHMLRLRPSRDHVTGTKNGTRYLAPASGSPEHPGRRDQPRMSPLSRYDGVSPVFLVFLVPAGIRPGYLAISGPGPGIPGRQD